MGCFCELTTWPRFYLIHCRLTWIMMLYLIYLYLISCTTVLGVFRYFVIILDSKDNQNYLQSVFNSGMVPFMHLYLCLQLISDKFSSQTNNYYSGTCIMKLRKSYEKHTNFIIYLVQFLKNHVYSPCGERPPVLRHHKIYWSLYTSFTVFGFKVTLFDISLRRSSATGQIKAPRNQ